MTNDVLGTPDSPVISNPAPYLIRPRGFARIPFTVTDALLLLIAVGASGSVYAPLLENYFWNDDFFNLYRISNFGFWEYVLTPHGGHTLLARNLVFYLCALAFGAEPAGYFWVVFLTHLLNVVLLFFVIRRLTGSAHLACFGATLWGVSPVHDGALGWYAVYGYVMATTALLLILNWTLRLHEQSPSQRRRTLIVCFVTALIGTVSFGVGIGFAMVLPFVIALLAPTARASARWGLPLVSLLVVVPVFYVGLFAINGYFFGEGVETPRLVAKYIVELWGSIITNTIHLMSYGLLRLLTVFWFDPAWVTTKTSYITFAIFAAVILLAVLSTTKEIRNAILASLLLALACYGFIAMGRAALFQALTKTLMSIQPRYHYGGLVPFTLLLCLVLAGIVRTYTLPPVLKAMGLALALGAIGHAYAESTFHVDQHADAREQVGEVQATVMSSVEAAAIGGDVYIPNRSFAGFYVVELQGFPGWAAVFTIFHPTNIIEGRHVYFVDKRPAVVSASARGRRTSVLIVAAQPSSHDKGAPVH